MSEKKKSSLPTVRGRIKLLLYYQDLLTKELEFYSRDENMIKFLTKGKLEPLTDVNPSRRSYIQRKLWHLKDQWIVDRRKKETKNNGRNPYVYFLTENGRKRVGNWIDHIRENQSPLFAPHLKK